MTGREYLGWRNVSRETSERLEEFERLLRKWNPVINLVASSTLESFKQRHLVDSAQLYDLAGAAWTHWGDLGSGGGFPGMVIAILAAESRPGASVTLVESDQRKAVFLATVIRELGLNTKIVAERIETASPLGADIISARALAPLAKLLGYAAIHRARNGAAFFPKGTNYQAELLQVEGKWLFSCEKIGSQTDQDAVVLKIKGLSRV